MTNVQVKPPSPPRGGGGIFCLLSVPLIGLWAFIEIARLIEARVLETNIAPAVVAGVCGLFGTYYFGLRQSDRIRVGFQALGLGATSAIAVFRLYSFDHSSYLLGLLYGGLAFLLVAGDRMAVEER